MKEQVKGLTKEEKRILSKDVVSLRNLAKKAELEFDFERAKNFYDMSKSIEHIISTT